MTIIQGVQENLRKESQGYPKRYLRYSNESNEGKQEKRG